MKVNSRYLLYPVSVLYKTAVSFRNFLFDKGILSSSQFNFPIICVGNLAVGGTGKTPMTEYLIELLHDKYKVATLSRGYKRKTKGFTIAHSGSTAHEIGDEPMQFHQKYPHITVSVGEERLVAIPQLLHDRPETNVIILDDAFQHRQVQAGLNILLTDYSHLYTNAHQLPVGNLRDTVKSAARAQIIIVTKCPENLSRDESEAIIKKLKPLPHQRVYFTTIVYGTPIHLFNHSTIHTNPETEILLVCGIANPEPLTNYLKKKFNRVTLLQYNDHYIFHSDDLEKIRDKYNSLTSSEKIILTTEKDGVRLEKFKNEFEAFPVFVLPIRHSFLFEATNDFNALILDFIESFPKIPLTAATKATE